jgi:hypothetical protein
MRKSLVSEKDVNPKLMGRDSPCGKVYSLACVCYAVQSLQIQIQSKNIQKSEIDK